jgi:hypothetical protein
MYTHMTAYTRVYNGFPTFLFLALYLFCFAFLVSSPTSPGVDTITVTAFLGARSQPASLLTVQNALANDLDIQQY